MGNSACAGVSVALQVMTCKEMAAADRATIDAQLATGRDLMERAGAALCDCVVAHGAGHGRIDILCGPGNNGGDGYVAARLLARYGSEVRVHALGHPRAGSDAALAAADWDGPVLPLNDFKAGAGNLVVDALFGAGFHGQLPDIAVAAFDDVARKGCPVVAVDVPSGVDGDTGQFAAAPQCVATVTFHRLKPAHLLAPSAARCGAITCADIGIRAGGADIRTWHNGPDLWRDRLPDGQGAAHKYARGHVAVFSGPELSGGAARLSAMAAARTGAGAVTLIGDTAALRVHAAHVTSIMLKAQDGDAPLTDALAGLNRVRSVVIGPGFARRDRLKASLPDLLRSFEGTAVLDADALTAFEDAPDALFAALADRPGQVVMTPHAGEFARLFADIAADRTLGKLQQARAAAERAKAIVLYKGPDTVIAHPDGGAVISTNGTAALATAGSGDVLAGIIAGLSAQRMDAFDAACASAWLHAQAGRQAGRQAIAEDLAQALGPVLAQMR